VAKTKKKGAEPELPDAEAIHNGAPNVRVVVSGSASPEVVQAAAELVNTLSQITGKAFPAPSPVEEGTELITVLVGSDVPADEPSTAINMTHQAYRITSKAQGNRWTLKVRGGSPAAIQYALYDLCQRLGTRYLHPEQTFYRSDAEYELPLPIDIYRRADLDLRGFYSRTRHPVPLADFLFTAAPPPEYGQYLDNVLVWLVRNRLNVAAFDVLNSVDTATWTTFVAPYVDRAHGMGIEVHPVVSFADDTGNSFRLIGDLGNDATNQIETQLDVLMAAPFDRIVVRTDSSPLTRPPDAVLVGWINAAAAHLAEDYPGVELLVEVGARGDVQAEDGGLFSHVAAQADPSVSLLVRTAMLWEVSGPAPVLGRSSFSGQAQLLATQSGGRKLYYGPQTAHWRGFDIDVPLMLPVIGLSRAEDLRTHLSDATLLGQITESGGWEWGYWLWDVAAARFAWDREETLDHVLAHMRPVIGKAYEQALSAWATQQRQVFLEQDPNLLFYLTGERPADEVGLLFGEASRPNRTTLAQVYAMDEPDYLAWKDGDLAALTQLRSDLTAVIEPIPEPEVPDEKDDTLKDQVRREIDHALRMTLLRFDLVINAYNTVVAVREPLEDPDEQEDRVDALEAAVRDAVKAAEKRIKAAETLYRYPAVHLYGKREDADQNPIPSPTTFDTGYLDATHEAFYWERREEELETFLGSLNSTDPGKWAKQPAFVFRVDRPGIAVTAPETPAAAVLLQPLIPSLLVGVHSWPGGDGDIDVTIATDRDGDGRPDPGSQVRIDDGFNSAKGALLQESELRVRFTDLTGSLVGELVLAPINFLFSAKHAGQTFEDIVAADLDAQVEVASAAALITGLSGGTIDNAGALSLLQDAAGVSPLPDRFDIHVTYVGFELQSAEP